MHVPVCYFKAIGSSLDWKYQTDPNTSGLNGRSLAWPRGKVLGGSSSLNGLLYIRGLKTDYDAWAEAGNQGWSYEELLPHFRRSEDAPFDHPDRGRKGPMSVCEGSYRTDLAERRRGGMRHTCLYPPSTFPIAPEYIRAPTSTSNSLQCLVTGIKNLA